MADSTAQQPVVVIPNWNASVELLEAVDSLVVQTLKPHIIVVDNGSTDDSVAKLSAKYPDVEIILHSKNKGYAGGVNPGFRRAIELGVDYTAPFNDDAIADKDWLKELVQVLDTDPTAGVVASKVLHADGVRLDSTGDTYTSWGLPYPRGRNEVDSGQYDGLDDIFAASGAASLYRVEALKQVGLLDEDFFAYYEDVDLSFRLQLAGWKVRYEPRARVYHRIGMTSGRIKGFTTYQTIKNLPWLLLKNAPFSVFIRVLPRFTVAYYSFILSAAWRGQSWPALRGYFVMLALLPKKVWQRWRIQHRRKVSAAYIWTIMDHELPPNARKLRMLFYPFRRAGARK